MKYCDQCGRPLKDEANFCDFCGRECKKPSACKMALHKNHKPPKKSGFKRFIAAVVVISVICTVAAAVAFFRNKSKISPVHSAEEAISQLEKLGDCLGYENALSELTVKTTTTIDGDSYYRLQQNYQGIPVYGRTVVYVADEKGGILAVASNVIDVDNKINLIPTISFELAEESITTYFSKKFGIEDVEYIKIGNVNEQNLIIYSMGEDIEFHLAYSVDVYFESKTEIGGYKIIVDANDARILLSESLIKNDTPVTGDLQGQEKLYRDVTYSYGENGFKLADLQLVINSYIAVNKMSLLDFLSGSKASQYKEVKPVIWTKEEPDKQAVDAYVNAQISYAFFDEVLQNCSTDGDGIAVIELFTGVVNFENKNWEGNAFSQSTNQGTELRTQLVFGDSKDGRVSLSTFLDTVAHEYMHGVEHYHSNMIYIGESGAIMEGLSDIFGELVEGWYKGINGARDADPNWIHNNSRNLRNPKESGNPWAYQGENWVNTNDLSNDNGGIHKNSTVISHVAYLMWNGGVNGDNTKKISSSELAKLWYRAMLMMPSDCDFAECRTLVELAGRSMNLSDEQIQCIREAFDAVGILDGEAVDYELNIDSTLCVYGADSELCSDYTIQIEGKRSTFEKLGKEDYGFPLDIVKLTNNLLTEYSGTIEVTTAEAIKLNLPVGIYTITLNDDLNTGKDYTFRVSIGSAGGLDNLDIYTDFGKGKLLRQVNTYENDVLNCITVFSYNENGLITEVTDHYYGEEYRYSESISTFAYDYADRVIESRLSLGSAKEYSESTEYIYNDKGQLASIHRKDTHGEGIITYEYDAQGKLVRAVSEDEGSRTVFLYDEDGNVLESTTYYNNGQTYTVKGIHQTRIIYDGEYKPFIIRATEVANTGAIETVFAQIEDMMGTAIYSFPLENPEFTADGDGYLVKVKDVWQYSDIVRTYLFYYDGDELPEKAEGTPTEPQNAGNEPQKEIGKLEYPISEKDACIIFKNYFGSEFDDENITVEISRAGEGDSEMLLFDIKMEFFTGKPPMTWGFFNVYVNTGRCTGGAQGHEDIWPVFQAEDYY